MKHRLPRPKFERTRKPDEEQNGLPIAEETATPPPLPEIEPVPAVEPPAPEIAHVPALPPPLPQREPEPEPLPEPVREFEPASPEPPPLDLPQQRAPEVPPWPEPQKPVVLEEPPVREEIHPPADEQTVVEEENRGTVIAAEAEPKRNGPPPLPFRTLPARAPKPVLVEGHAPLLIQTSGLVKQYGGRRVVNGVDIHVAAGEVVGLLGKNGAGKTTTFYMIVGLVPPTEGHVYMGAEDVTRMPMYRRARRGIGYLPQEESIFRKLSVEENLLAILETLPMTEEERDARCDELLKDFGLQHVRHNIAITLSGGEKRRVTIARALVTSPSLLLLDEPFSGVDPMAVHDIQEIILHLKERGLGVLITDHNVRETLSVVDRAYIIDEGRVLSQGSRDFLINDPVAREIYLGHRFTM
jgi:lipopolysaccharide export system ATP-binding protein